MKRIIRKGIIKKSVLILVGSALLMFIYEYSKQTIFPQITIWTSHIITITFVAVLSSVMSYFYFLSISLKELYSHELNKRVRYQDELTELNKNLEKIIDDRTKLLQKTNIDLQNAKEKAEELNDLKTVFLHNMTHEIRTPLNAIMGFSDIIKSGEYKNDKLPVYSSIIHDCSADLLNIINEILDASKIEAGQMTVYLEEVRLLDLMEEICIFFINDRQRFNNSDVELKVSNKNFLTDSIIITDKMKLKQIFVNLIYNAFKYTEAGKIEIGWNEHVDNNYFFYVSDTGIGIEEKNLSAIFDRFIQVENDTTRKHKGTGLGLSIVKGLVELLGGKIEVSSTIGKGSIFSFSLPSRVLMPENPK